MTRKKGPKIDSSQIEEMNKEVGELLARCFDEVGEAPLRELNAFLDRAPPDKYLRHRAFVANECGEPSKALDYLRRWPQHARQESPTPFDCEEFHNAIELFLDNPPRGIWSALAEAFAIAWPDSAATHCLQGLAEQDKGDSKAAIRSFSECLKKDEHFWYAAKELGGLFGDQGDLEQARWYCQQALRDIPPELTGYVAGLHASLGETSADSQEAATHYLKALNADPGAWEAAADLGNIYFEQKNWDVARDYYVQALRDIQPELTDTPGLAVLAAELNGNLGNVYCEQKNWRQAVTYYRYALEHAPEDKRAVYHVLVGICLLVVKEFEGARSAFSQSLSLDPQLSGTRTFLGKSLLGTRRYEEAVTVLREAFGRKDEHSFALSPLVAALRKLRRYDEAIEVCRQDTVHRGGLSKWAQAQIGQLETLIEKQRRGEEGPQEETPDALSDELSDNLLSGVLSTVSGRGKRRPVRNRRPTIPRESILEEWLHGDIERGEKILGLRLRVYESPDGRPGGYGRQFALPGGGRVDLLGEDLDTGDLVVLELKRDAGGREVVGQILGYMASVREHVAAPGQRVRGIIVVSEASPEISRAASVVPDLEVRVFTISTSTEPDGKV